jgi:hypothetical protein
MMSRPAPMQVPPTFQGCKEKYRSSTQEKTRRCGYKPEKNSGLLKVVGAHATIAKKAPAAKPAASAASAVK